MRPDPDLDPDLNIDLPLDEARCEGPEGERRPVSTQPPSTAGAAPTAAPEASVATGYSGQQAAGRYVARVERYDSRARAALQTMARWLGLSARQLNGLERLHAAQVMRPWI